MILFGPPAYKFGDLEIFPDHQNEKQFYYIPTEISVAMGPDGEPVFSFLRYEMQECESANLNFDVKLNVLKEQFLQAENKLNEFVPQSRLTVAPLTTGSVQLIVSENMMNSKDIWVVGEVSAPPFMESKSAFALQLSGEEVERLWQAFQNEDILIALFCKLVYTGVSPVYNVAIEGNWQVIYQHFSSISKEKNRWAGTEIREEIEYLIENEIIKIVEARQQESTILTVSDDLIDYIVEKSKELLFENPIPQVTFENESLTDENLIFTLKQIINENLKDFYFDLQRQKQEKRSLYLINDLNEFYGEYGNDERYFREMNFS